jgi:ketosteroid isomerase-like protein
MSEKKIYATPQDAEAAFYEALEKSDLDGMMAVWAEDDEIVCVHPGGPRLTGYAMIREAWRRIFENGTRLRIELARHSTVTTPFAVLVSVIEHIGIHNQQGTSAPVAATNVFVRGALGWRLVAHHASAVPPNSLDEFDGLNDAPKVLH